MKRFLVLALTVSCASNPLMATPETARPHEGAVADFSDIANILNQVRKTAEPGNQTLSERVVYINLSADQADTIRISEPHKGQKLEGSESFMRKQGEDTLSLARSLGRAMLTQIPQLDPNIESWIASGGLQGSPHYDVSIEFIASEICKGGHICIEMRQLINAIHAYEIAAREYYKNNPEAKKRDYDPIVKEISSIMHAFNESTLEGLPEELKTDLRGCDFGDSKLLTLPHPTLPCEVEVKNSGSQGTNRVAPSLLESLDLEKLLRSTPIPTNRPINFFVE